MSEDDDVSGLQDFFQGERPSVELIGAEEQDIPQSLITQNLTLGMPLWAPINAWWLGGFPFLVGRVHFPVHSPCN
jgi:hypothetical protein